jgi:hypothetical protein
MSRTLPIVFVYWVVTSSSEALYLWAQFTNPTDGRGAQSRPHH